MLIVALAFGALAPNAGAQWVLGGDAEYFSWTEATQPIRVAEHGLRVGITLGYTQPRDGGFLFAYRGAAYLGVAGYAGAQFLDPSTPAAGTTGYVGTTQEGQLRYRTGGNLDLLAAIGAQLWRRELNANQGEDYRIVLVAAGAEYNARSPGLTVGAKLKYPVWTQLDAHATSIGLAQNPILAPGRDFGGSCEIGYRSAGNWALIGYFDKLRFKESPHRLVTDGGVPVGTFFQPAIDTYVVGVRAELTR